MIRGHARGHSQIAVIEVQLDQSFGMLGNKRDWRHDDRDPVPTRAANLVVGCRTDPIQRPDPTLIADRPIKVRLVQRGDHGRGGCLDLVGVRITSLDDPFRQAVGGEQQTRRFFVTGSRIKRRSDQPGYCFDKSRIRGIAAHNPRWAFNPTACCRGTPSGERRSRRCRRELRIERQTNDLVRRPIGDVSRSLLAGRGPVAHCDKTPVLRSQNCFERSCLRLGVGEQRRPAAELTIDLLRYPASTPRDNARQRQPNERRQTEDGRVAEQVE